MKILKFLSDINGKKVKKEPRKNFKMPKKNYRENHLSQILFKTKRF